MVQCILLLRQLWILYSQTIKQTETTKQANMLWRTFSSHLSNPNILDYLMMKQLETEQSPLNSWLLKPPQNTVNAWKLYTTDVKLRYQLLTSIQDTTNCPALHLQVYFQVFASREVTCFKPLQWGKHTLVKCVHSWPQHVTEHETTVKKKKKGKTIPQNIPNSWLLTSGPVLPLSS